MKQKKEKTGSVKINEAVFEQVREHCRANGIVIGFFITNAAKEKLAKEKSSIQQVK